MPLLQQHADSASTPHPPERRRRTKEKEESLVHSLPMTLIVRVQNTFFSPPWKELLHAFVAQSNGLCLWLLLSQNYRDILFTFDCEDGCMRLWCTTTNSLPVTSFLVHVQDVLFIFLCRDDCKCLWHAKKETHYPWLLLLYMLNKTWLIIHCEDKCMCLYQGRVGVKCMYLLM